MIILTREGSRRVLTVYLIHILSYQFYAASSGKVQASAGNTFRLLQSRQKGKNIPTLPRVPEIRLITVHLIDYAGVSVSRQDAAWSRRTPQSKQAK